jgi:flagellar biogenesis protein FliO
MDAMLRRRLRVAATYAAILCGSLTIAATMLRSESFGNPDTIPISPPGTKHAKPAGSTPETSLVKTGAILAIVVAGVGVAVSFARKCFPGLAPDSAQRLVRVIGQAPLGSKGTVFVLRCGPRVLIVGGAAGQLNTLAEIADPDEIDEFVRLSGANGLSSRTSPPDSAEGTAPTRQLKGQVDGMLDRIDSWKSSG